MWAVGLIIGVAVFFLIYATAKKQRGNETQASPCPASGETGDVGIKKGFLLYVDEMKGLANKSLEKAGSAVEKREKRAHINKAEQYLESIIEEGGKLGIGFSGIDESRATIASLREKYGIEDDNVIAGYRFHATMQLRTPMRVLMLHGMTCGIDDVRPDVVKEEWEGCWTQRTKTWAELGIDLPDNDQSVASSDIGYVSPEEYLPFLKEIRAVVEDVAPISVLEERLRSVLDDPKWIGFVERFGGAGQIIGVFYPHIVTTIGLQRSAVAGLMENDIMCVGRIRSMADKELLAIPGIGKAALIKIREFCDSYAGDPESIRSASPVVR